MLSARAILGLGIMVGLGFAGMLFMARNLTIPMPYVLVFSGVMGLALRGMVNRTSPKVLRTFNPKTHHLIPWTPAQLHPAAGRFCHICGADADKNERCDAGLHS